jgi:hypothetical protein
MRFAQLDIDQGERISIACYTVAALSKRHAND